MLLQTNQLAMALYFWKKTKNKQTKTAYKKEGTHFIEKHLKANQSTPVSFE
jgi:hypothetical protein